MTPIFFPFTDMSKSTAADLPAVFKQAILYRPSDGPLPEFLRQQAESGFLDIRIPIKGDEDQINQAAMDYRTWAERHSGGPLVFFKSQQGYIPFFEESSLSRIRSDIRQWAKAESEPVKEAKDPVFAARLFLSVAQAYDREQWEVDAGFAGLRDLEDSLLKSIHGESEAAGSSLTAPVQDLGALMTDLRLWAWSRLWAADPEASNLLITDSREVFEATMDPLFDSPCLDRFDIVWPLSASAPRDELDRFLKDLSEGNADPAQAPQPAEKDMKQITLSMFRVQGMGLLEVMARAAGRDRSLTPGVQKENEQAGTVVVFLDFSG